MKNIRKLFAAALIMCLLTVLMPCASAEGSSAYDFEGRSWNEVIDDFVSKHSVPDDAVLTLGYYNTVTGEEYYLNGDEYTDAASTYKVPLNMLYAEQLAEGKMSLETEIGGYKYSELLRRTLVESNNELAQLLWDNYGGYNVYRRAIAKYASSEPEKIGQEFFVNNYITARQALTVLRTLYENQENFPYIIDTMLTAEPDNYFAAGKPDFKMAHKYGLLKIADTVEQTVIAEPETEEEDNSEPAEEAALAEEVKPIEEIEHYYINDTAIVYTDEPIIIVFFSDKVPNALDMMAEYCTLMCDYTQYHSNARAEQAMLASANDEKDLHKQMSVIASKIEKTATEAELQLPELTLSTFVLGVLAIAVGVVVLIIVIGNHRKVGVFWGFIASVLISVTLLVCLLGTSVGVLITGAIEEDPIDTVTEFFDAIALGNYTAAYEHLNGYSSLGLENSPEGEAAKLLSNALERSYSYSLSGAAVIDGITARQDVSFNYLDIAAIDEQVQILTPKKLNELVAENPRSKIYDENNEYLPEITQKAYINALKEVLSNAESFSTGTTLTISLDYINKTWLITPDQALFKALLGGISY